MTEAESVSAVESTVAQETLIKWRHEPAEPWEKVFQAERIAGGRGIEVGLCLMGSGGAGSPA